MAAAPATRICAIPISPMAWQRYQIPLAIAEAHLGIQAAIGAVVHIARHQQEVGALADALCGARSLAFIMVPHKDCTATDGRALAAIVDEHKP